jgi:hypothetical protein
MTGINVVKPLIYKEVLQMANKIREFINELELLGKEVGCNIEDLDITEIAEEVKDEFEYNIDCWKDNFNSEQEYTVRYIKNSLFTQLLQSECFEELIATAEEINDLITMDIDGGLDMELVDYLSVMLSYVNNQ